MVQPFHQAAAAEDTVGEPEPESVPAESVREQQEPAGSSPTETESEQAEDSVTNDNENESSTVNQDNEVAETDDEEVNSSSESTNESDEGDNSQEQVNEEQSSASSTSNTTNNTTNNGSNENQSGTASSANTGNNEVNTGTATSTPTTGSSTSTATTSDNGTSTGGSSGGSTDNSNDESTEVGESESTENQSEDIDNENEDNVDEDAGTENEEEVTVPETSTTSATSSGDTPVVPAEILISEDNFYQFSRQSCVEVGDGTYHCSSSDVTEYDNQSVVYSELGSNGNLEIFLRTSGGEVRQITDNEFDDAAPYYDAETLQIVWQRLIDGRHQVILYDIADDEESQLTFSRTNNMEPKVSKDGVVWQAWDNNDWEIMYFDGRFTDQITDNNTQDVAPVIQDKYILWTVIGRGEQEGKVYSLDSEELLTISGYDGGLIENPRFVLVYDTKFDNGDVITQGFDPATGISEPIAAKPAPEPVDVPMTDPTGEIRALIQNKSSFEDELDKQLVHSDNGSSSNSTTISDTLDLKDDTEEETQHTATSTDETFELTEFDLILSDVEVNFDELEEIDEIMSKETSNNTASSTQQ